ncbi:putative holin-like toxin [Streptococcus hyointestinalis]|nr:putative holin-like toxin [Streptococcus hyointestinalis]
MSVAEALQVMFAFGGFIISLLTLVIALIMLDRQK